MVYSCFLYKRFQTWSPLLSSPHPGSPSRASRLSPRKGGKEASLRHQTLLPPFAGRMGCNTHYRAIMPDRVLPLPRRSAIAGRQPVDLVYIGGGSEQPREKWERNDHQSTGCRGGAVPSRLPVGRRTDSVERLSESPGQ